MNAPEHAYDDVRHGELRAAITAELTRVMREAYAALEVPHPANPLNGLPPRGQRSDAVENRA